MSLDARLVSLERKHKDIHMRVEALEAEKAPEGFIKPLKKEKLKLKDEIIKIKHMILDKNSRQ